MNCHITQDNVYLQSIVLGDSFHHVWHSGLKNFLKCQGVHHGENPSKVFQNLLLLFHAHSLTVGHPDVCLLVIGNLHLVSRNITPCNILLKDLGSFYACTPQASAFFYILTAYAITLKNV